MGKGISSVEQGDSSSHAAFANGWQRGRHCNPELTVTIAAPSGLRAAARAAPPAMAALKSVFAAALPAASTPLSRKKPATLLLLKKSSLGVDFVCLCVCKQGASQHIAIPGLR